MKPPVPLHDQPWSKVSYFVLPEGPGARWRTHAYCWNKYAPEGMVEYRLTLHDDLVCITPDGGASRDPLPIEPRMTWEEAVTYLSRCAVAPPMRYNGPENRPTSISFVLAEASAPWYSWSGYVSASSPEQEQP